MARQIQRVNANPGIGLRVRTSQAAGVTWTPALPTSEGGSLPVLWISADFGTWQDAARTIPAILDNDPVGGWTDRSTFLNHAQQGAAASRPTLKLNIINGLPALRLDGLNDFMTITDAPELDGTAVTIFIAYNMTSIPAAIMAKGRDGFGSWSFRPAINNRLWGYRTTVPPGNQYVDPAAASSWTLAANIILSTGYDGANFFARENGAGIGSNAVAVTTFGTNALDVYLARFTDGVLGYAAGDLFEIAMYNVALSVNDRTQVENYLNGKYVVF